MTAHTSKPIAQRVFQMMLIWNFFSITLILGCSWWALETLESTNIEADRLIELDYFEHYGNKSKPLYVKTSHFIHVYQPFHSEQHNALPIVFQGNFPVPFQGEKDILGVGYSVITHAFPEGIFYMAKDLRPFEAQEEIMIGVILVLAVILSIVMFGFFCDCK